MLALAISYFDDGSRNIVSAVIWVQTTKVATELVYVPRVPCGQTVVMNINCIK